MKLNNKVIVWETEYDASAMGDNQEIYGRHENTRVQQRVNVIVTKARSFATIFKTGLMYKFLCFAAGLLG